jgi:hypothetical protein
VGLGYVDEKDFSVSPTATTQAMAVVQAEAWQTGTDAAQVSTMA